MERRILVVAADLMARARLDQAASDSGYEVVTGDAAGISESVRRHDPAVVVIDLDRVGSQDLDTIAAAASSSNRRVIGFYSHVDEDLGRAAADAGIEALPRGRFWREVSSLLATP